MNSDDYFQYLNRGSWLGTFYRRHFICRKISRYVSGKVIDVGCGLGHFLEMRPGTLGADVNPKTVEFCRSKGLEAVLIDSFPWPLETQSFDGVVMDNVLEHIENPKPVLEEVSRILKKNGTLVAGVPGRIGYKTDPDHKIYYDKKLLTETLQAFGFTPVHFFSTPINFSWLEKYVKRYCLYGVFRLNQNQDHLSNA